MNMASFIRDSLVQLTDDVADLPGVGADGEVPKLMDGGLTSPAKAVEGSFPDAPKPFVRDHPHEQPILPARANQVGLDPDDLHGPPPLAPTTSARSGKCNQVVRPLVKQPTGAGPGPGAGPAREPAPVVGELEVPPDSGRRSESHHRARWSA